MTSTLAPSVFGLMFLVLGPVIIVANARKPGVVMDHLWRQNPWLARLLLIFIGLTWLIMAVDTATYWGILSGSFRDRATSAILIPMQVLLMTILVMGAVVLARYFKSRWSA